MEHSSTDAFPRYHMPTHLEVEDTFAFPLLGFTLTVTAREGLILFVGWSTAFQLWRSLAWLAQVGGWPGLLIQDALALLLALAALALAKLTIMGRSLEEWLMIVLRYHMQPHIYIWQRSMAGPLATSLQETSGEILATEEEEE